MKDLTIEQCIRLFFIVSLVAIGLLTVKHIFIFLYPLLIALCLAFFYHPIVLFITNRFNLPKLLVTIITVVLSFIILLTISLWFISEVVQGIIFFIEFIPKHFTSFIIFIEQVYEQYILPIYERLFTGNKQPLMKQSISQMMTNVQNNVISLLEGIVMKVLSFLAIFPYSFAMSLFILVATILITNDWIELRNRLQTIMPQRLNKKIASTFNHFKTLLINYFKAQLIIVMVTAIIIFSGLLLLNIEHALTITFFTALVDLLPIIGTGVIFVPWIVYLFLNGNFPLTIGITFLYIFVVVVRQMIEPKIISQHLGVRPLTALLCLFFGVQLWGVGGLIIAPFLLIFGQTLVKAGVFPAIWNFIKGTPMK